MRPFPVKWNKPVIRDHSSGYQPHANLVEYSGLCIAFVRGDKQPEAIVKRDGRLLAVPIRDIIVDE
jgi:hypothetical protein